MGAYRFHYMVVADNRQRLMPLPDDRQPERGEPLDFPEAVLLVDPVEPEFKGEVPIPPSSYFEFASPSVN